MPVSIGGRFAVGPVSSASPGEGVEAGPYLIDVTGLDLDRLDALPDSVLISALRRVVHESRVRPEEFSQFANSIRPDDE